MGGWDVTKTHYAALKSTTLLYPNTLALKNKCLVRQKAYVVLHDHYKYTHQKYSIIIRHPIRYIHRICHKIL